MTTQALRRRAGGNDAGRVITIAAVMCVVLGLAIGWGLGFFVAAAVVAAAAVLVARELVRREIECSLLLVAGGSLLPIPQPGRSGLLVGAVMTIVGVAIADYVWPRGEGLRLATPERAVLGGIAALDAAIVAGSVWSGHPETISPFLIGATFSTLFAWALYRRVQAVGPLPVAIGVAGASTLASALILLRLGGLPLIGSEQASTYVGAKDVVVTALGDVNGQALVVTLGLPLLLAFALHTRTRGLLVASVGGTVLAALALMVLLSRSSLIGAAIGLAVTTLGMARMSRRRAAVVLLLAVGVAGYFASGVEQLSSDTTNLQNRSVLWRTAGDFWHQSPWLGFGADSWPRLVAENVRWAPPQGDGGTHNLVLSALVSGGVIGAALAVALVVTVVVVGIRNLWLLRRTGDRLRYAILAGALGAFTAQFVRGTFEATGWPGTRTHDLRTWAGILVLAIVVLLTSTPPERGEPEAGARRGDPGR